MAKFEVLEVSLEMITLVRPLIAAIAQHDRNLADQLRRSASSVPLNISEGTGRAGRDRLHSYRIAAGSVREASTTLAVAQAWGYIAAQQALPVSQLIDR